MLEPITVDALIKALQDLKAEVPGDIGQATVSMVTQGVFSVRETKAYGLAFAPAEMTVKLFYFGFVPVKEEVDV